MELVKDDRIVVQFINSELIVKRYGQKLGWNDDGAGSLKLASTGKYAISSDGKFMAYVREFDTVQII